MKRIFFAGDTDQHIDIFIANSSVTNGAGLTGLAHDSTGLTCYYRIGQTGVATELSLITQTVAGAHNDGGFVEIHATHMPGSYRLDLPDALFTVAGPVTIELKGAANMAPCPIELQVVSETRGLAGTALPAVAAGANNGLPLQGGAIPNANADAAGGLPVSDAGNLDLDTILGRIIGTIAAGTHNPQTGDSYARLGAPTAASIAADLVNLANDLGIVGSATSAIQNDLDNPTDGLGALKALLDLIKAVTDALPNGGSLSDINTALNSVLLDTGTNLPATLATIQSKTDNLPASPAAVGSEMTLSLADQQALADEVLKRGAANVEDTADPHSLAGIILAILESSISGTTWTIRKTGGGTFEVKTLTLDANADPITSVT